MESDVYFAQEPPKSTGRETFKEAWLEKVLARLALSGASKLEPRDVQATLVRLTAATAARDITLAHNMLQRRQGDTGTAAPAGWTVVLCGGGARNSFLREALAAVFEKLLPEFAAFVVGQEDAMALASPVDAGIPSFRIAHGRTSYAPSSRRNLRRSLYWRSERRTASGANSPRDVDHGQSLGAQVPPRWSSHRGRSVAPERSARSPDLTLFLRAGVLATFRYATLRKNIAVRSGNRV